MLLFHLVLPVVLALATASSSVVLVEDVVGSLGACRSQQIWLEDAGDQLKARILLMGQEEEEVVVEMTVEDEGRAFPQCFKECCIICKTYWLLISKMKVKI